MPVVRYFLFVGVALLALLFGIDAYVQKPPPAEVPRATTDLSMIRIRSDHKWPERVVFDTSLPTITHPSTPMRVVTIPPAAEGSEKAGLRESIAQAQPADLKKQ